MKNVASKGVFGQITVGMAALLIVSGLAIGCGDASKTGTPNATTAPTSKAAPTGKPAAHGHAHAHDGEPHDLGEQQVGEYKVKVVQRGEAEAGEEGVFEVKVQGDKAVVSKLTVTIWVGDATGKELSARVKADYMADHNDFDGHVDLPKTMPKDAMVWVEVKSADGAKSGKAGYKLHDDHKH